MQGAERGYRRLEAAFDQVNEDTEQRILQSLQLRSIERIDSLETLHIYDLRDEFKRDNRTLVLLTIPGTQVPAEIADHTLVLDEPLPAPEDLKGVVESVIEDARKQNPGFPAT